MLWPKKNSYKEFDNDKKFLPLENSPPLHNFCNGPSFKEVLGLLPYEGIETPSFPTFQVKRRDCMKILLPYGNTIFAILFCFVLCTKSLL